MRPLLRLRIPRLRRLAAAAGLAVALAAPALWASDACSTRAVHTIAQVEASDGSTFRTETLFRSADHAVIRQFDEDVQTVAVEGPLAWVAKADRSQLGNDTHKRFAMGHQYHALLLYFDELVDPIEHRPDLLFAGELRWARSGPFPHGGRVYEVAGDESAKPLGYRFELPDTPPIEVTLDDWRRNGDLHLPYRVHIDDGSRRFEYRYETVDLAEKPLDWFSQALAGPDLDELQIYRLHRQILAAHCLGDATRIAALTAPETMEVNRGQLRHSTREATLGRFENLFRRLDYRSYVDRVEPAIAVSESGDIGWIAVEVGAAGSAIETGEAFHAQWAWIMLTRKIDGRWLNAGIASNSAP